MMRAVRLRVPGFSVPDAFAIMRVPFPFPQPPSARLPEGAYTIGILCHAGCTCQGKKIFRTIMRVRKIFFDPAGNLDMYIRHGSRQSERHGRRKPQTPEGLWLDLTPDTGRIYAHAAVGGLFSHSLLPLPGRSVCLPRRIPCASVAEPVCSVKGRKIFFKDSQKVLKFVMLRKSSLKKFFLAFGKPLTEQPEPASCAQWVYDDGKAYGSCSERQVERMRKKE